MTVFQLTLRLIADLLTLRCRPGDVVVREYDGGNNDGTHKAVMFAGPYRPNGGLWEQPDPSPDVASVHHPVYTREQHKGTTRPRLYRLD